jgi:hypothetical protein
MMERRSWLANAELPAEEGTADLETSRYKSSSNLGLGAVCSLNLHSLSLKQHDALMLLERHSLSVPARSIYSSQRMIVEQTNYVNNSPFAILLHKNHKMKSTSDPWCCCIHGCLPNSDLKCELLLHNGGPVSHPLPKKFYTSLYMWLVCMIFPPSHQTYLRFI